jgi:hypothetical protein
MGIKRKITPMVILIVVLMLVVFSNYSVAEVEATGNQVSLSSKDTKYYGIFVTGEGNPGPNQLKERKLFDKDARRWRDALLNLGQGWAENRMSFLQQPTPQQLRDDFTATKALVRSGDEFHFYYSGHGRDNTGEMYLGLANYWSGGDLKTALSGFVKGVTISVTLDSCYSYKLQNSIQDIVDSRGDSIDPTCLATIAATSADHPKSFFATEDEYYYGSHFSYYLLFTFKLHRRLLNGPISALYLFQGAKDVTEIMTSGKMKPSYAAPPEHKLENLSGRGDLNCDGVTNVLDLSYMARSLGTNVNMTHGTNWGQYNPDCDLNGDNIVDGFDLAIVAADYGWELVV